MTVNHLFHVTHAPVSEGLKAVRERGEGRKEKEEEEGDTERDIL